MEKIFLKVLNMSATASVVILAVLLMRLLLRKAPKKYSYWLWAVVGFRLCCPVSISSALSLLNFVPSAPSRAAGRGTVMQFIPDDIALAPQPRVELITPRLSEAINHSLPAATPQYSANPMQIWLFIGAVLWCVGMAALLVYSVVSVWRLRRRVATATRLDGSVWQSENVSSPFILGVFAPRIYLPYHLGEQEREYVLAHEKYHLKRRDYLVKLFAFALLTVHWFNPLCYLAFFLMTRDMEMSCDEAVLAKSDGIKTAYSTTLLSFAANRRFPSAIPLAFGESTVGSRIKNVLSWKAPKRYVAPVAFLLCAAIVLVCAMNPRQTLGEVCGEFWDNAAVSTYTEEQLSGPNVQYHPEEPLRLCDYLSGVRIGAAHKEKTVAIAPEWSTLYLALPGADGTDTQRFTIDFVREHDPLDGPEPVYSLNIGTKNDTRNYEVLSGQEQIDAFLAYLRGEALPEGYGDVLLCTHADIDRDGENETFYVYETEIGGIYRLDVLKRDGSVIYTAEVGLPHAGWGEIFLCETDGGSVLLQYHPTVYQGIANYSFEAFTIDANAMPVILDSDSVDFVVDDMTEEQRERYDHFVAHINGYLFRGRLLMGVSEGKFFCGGRMGELYSLADGLANAYEVNGGAADLIAAFDALDLKSTTINHRTNVLSGSTYQADGAICAQVHLDTLRAFKWMPCRALAEEEEREYPRVTLSCDDTELTFVQSGEVRLRSGEGREQWFKAMDIDSTQYAWMAVNEIFEWFDEARATAQFGGDGIALTSWELVRWRERTASIENYLDENGYNCARSTAISCFFTSYYDDVRDLDLGGFLMYCPLGELVEDDAEFELVKKRNWAEDDGWRDFTISQMPIPVWRYTVKDISEALMQYAGITFDDLRGNWKETLHYVPETNAFYNYHSDFGPGAFRPLYGERNGDLLTLYGSGVDGVGAAELTLRVSGEDYKIVSHVNRTSY